MNSPQSEKNYEIVVRSWEELQKKTTVIETLADLAKDSSDERHRTLIGMAAFLWFFESGYAFCVDFFCYLLTIEGHDLFNQHKKKYAVSIEDIMDVDLASKMMFLEEHNLNILVRTTDKKIRNKIAHRSFSVGNCGKLWIDKEEIRIAERLVDLMRFATMTVKTFVECVKEASSKQE
jgi:hypothetical protein